MPVLSGRSERSFRSSQHRREKDGTARHDEIALLEPVIHGEPGTAFAFVDRDGDALEAVAFAILGYQMLRGRQGNIPTVTGARAPAVLGKLTMPPQPLQ